MFLIFRVTCGIGGGMLIANTPVYMAEVAPPHTRGVLGSAQGIAITTAYTVSSLTALGIHFIEKDYDWRLQYVIQGFFAMVLIVVTYFLPESPRWLTVFQHIYNGYHVKTDLKQEKGRYQEAWKILRRLHSTKFDPEARLAHAEFIQIKAQIEAERVTIYMHKALR
jgi:MFS family permease